MTAHAFAQAGSTAASGRGFVDLHLGLTGGSQSGNLILRTPRLVGGFSYDAFDDARDLVGFGALFRPLGEETDREILLGASYLVRDGARKWEAQAKYIGARGLGLGAGFAGDEAVGDIWFVSAIARGKRGAISYHASALAETGGGRTSPGGYVALYTDHLFLGGGTDGEQWRMLGALSANNGAGSALDPSIEILYVDNGIGSADGETFLFVNGSLKRNRGFLNAPSRLGRALAPQGIQFANPVSFASQPWSRTIDVWELGEIMNVRLARREFPDGATSMLAQTVVFPVQAIGAEGGLRGVFAGYERRRETREGAREDSILFGHAGRLGKVWITAAAAVDARSGAFSGAFGVKLFW